MDSVPTPVERQHVGVLTFLSAVVLVLFLAFMAWLQYGGSRVEEMVEPERALALIVGRTMDLDEGIERAPAWERAAYRFLLSDRASDVAEAFGWYEELAAASFDPAVDLHLAILEGESGRLASVQRRVDEWERRPDPMPALARLVASAYLAESLDTGDAAILDDETLVEALEPGWFRDRIAVRLAMRTGDAELLARATASQAGRSRPLLNRSHGMIVVELVLLVAGVLVLIRLVQRGDTLARIGAAVLPPPWRGRVGAVVLIRGGALGAITLVALYYFTLTGPDRPFARVALGVATNVAFLPVLLLARRRLLEPSGVTFAEGLGLVPAAGGMRRFLFVFLAVLSLGQLGGVVIDLVGRRLGLTAHWTEWFDRDLAWGSPLVVGLTVLDTVVLTPVFEEIVFRGLVFATLRRRFGVPGAALLSAGIFAIAHGYGVLGFAAVFWSGLLWAWAYERSGSLLPSIAAHAADNLMASLSVLLALRV
jgi:membrane protease YdiL (CAAX protease family)